MKHAIFTAAILVLGGSHAGASPNQWQREWPNTDFETTTIEDWAEIKSGGPPKDGIPAIDDPAFIAVPDEVRIGAREPVITVEIDGEVPRAYPIRYLTWHEIVNDTIGGVPVAVTCCPLCNSGMTFDRRVEGQVLSFGVSGKLRKSDMVMYDRETESWWQQAVGEGIVGDMTGVELTQLPTWMESWREFSTRNPDGLVMDEPGWTRPYGSNPYVGYDRSARPFLYRGELPPHDVPALARVIRVGDIAWTMERVRTEGPITEAGVTLSWTEGQASALDSDVIADSREVGTIRVKDANGIDVPHDVLFAFAYHAFWPDGTWMLGE